MSALQERIVASLCATVGPMLRGRASEELYALALTTDSDVVTLRLVAHTEQALTALLENAEDNAEDSAADADYYRWWPDEWADLDDDVTPDDGVESTGDLCEALYEAHASLGEDDALHDEWCLRARAALDGALGDARVLAAVREANPVWRPVLFVTDTDGDMRETVHSIDLLNGAHPDPALVASARAYFDQD
ncbi:DUF4303 domain-containing protein [Streptomyces cavernicola]|uniref:DUF4303 domain-containing protein n=1 Tax=Streptomyces cavernicola TaxID=3043613 RepID=A0ABT6SC65_9ACTN|nr:DUF4303 domain-containing protein [Streptomyces sp. B-S-A6]MDI3405554.1 DUF4303 domain-containing protein [Streptomyces sp. B-S-A6]